MPNTPAQFPNFDLPGAEWFGLAPNANISIQGRRRKAAVSVNQGAAAQVPPSTTLPFFGSVNLETGFLDTSAIYVHRVWLGLYTQGSIWINLASGSMSLNIDPNMTPGEVPYPIGQIFVQPSITVNPIAPAPPGSVFGQIIMLDRDFLVTYKDIKQFAGITGNVLNLTFMMGVWNNDTATASAPLGFYAGIVYTRLDGITE